jgi:hypothetical protein
MNPLKRDMLDGDLKAYVAQKRLKLSEALMKLKSNRKLSSVIMRKLAKYGAGFASMDDFIDALNYAHEKGKGLHDYSITINGNDTILIMEVGELYFIADQTIRAMLPRFHKKSHDGTDVSKEKWLKWCNKELKDYHDPDKWTRIILEGYNKKEES